MRLSLKSIVVIGVAALLGTTSLAIALSLGSTPKAADTREPPAKDGKPKTPKYFHEPTGSLARVHYDLRFFHDEIGYEEHRVVLGNLIRAYLRTFEDSGLETWLAHGTLLGWWWNGRIMPWDYDLDVQVTNHTMQWLADNMNGTWHGYNVTDPRREGAVKTDWYLLDVNPHQDELTRGDGRNIIDARWIDMQNGMFIDITAVRERDPSRPDEWSCKNKHKYASKDLWPMRLTEFEGVRARVPYNTGKVLASEYGYKSLVAEQWQNHRFDRTSKEWVRMTVAEDSAWKKEAKEAKKQDLLRQAGKS